MKRWAAICAFTITCAAVVAGQTTAVPSKWIGGWALSVQESEINQFWLPGAPNGLTVNDQILEITATPGHMKITIETATTELGSSREELDLALDGKEVVSRAGEGLSFKRIDDRTFDIIVSANEKKLGSHVTENHFVFSGRDKLTETTTHNWLEVGADGKDQSRGAVMRTSTSVLVFYKVLFIPHAGPTRFQNLKEQGPL
jgi:hypothetical protein